MQLILTSLIRAGGGGSRCTGAGPGFWTICFDNAALPSKVLAAPDGVVAQLVEHHNGIVGVRGSNPLGSTILRSERPGRSERRMVPSIVPHAGRRRAVVPFRFRATDGRPS